MYKYFGLTDNPQPFEIFSPPHLTALMLILLIVLMTILFRKRLRGEKVNQLYRYLLAGALLVQQFSFYLWHIVNGTWSLANGIPLNICGASIFLSIYLLITESKSVYELVYFWGLAGTAQALLTPDLQGYNYPHYRFFQFFLGHGMIVITVFFMTFVNRYRPNLTSLKKAFITSNIFAFFVFGINFLVDGNYMFLRHKPESASLLDFLGPWPWYIISLELMALLFFTLLYLPFLIKDFRKTSESEQESI